VSEERPREKIAVLGFDEPGPLDVEELEARNPSGQLERIDRKLGDRLVDRRIRLVVQDVHGTACDPKKIDVSGRGALGPMLSQMWLIRWPRLCGELGSTRWKGHQLSAATLSYVKIRAGPFSPSVAFFRDRPPGARRDRPLMREPLAPHLARPSLLPVAQGYR